MRKRLDPGPERLELGAGARKAVSHHGLIDQAAREGVALRCVGEGTAEGGASLGGGADGEVEPLVVEVCLGVGWRASAHVPSEWSSAPSVDLTPLRRR